ncbi:urease accessory protein UreF [Athelia psychrophila]|uniref:Urease accessory protein UreF n=1 Tax=Athelia psychrophila TaxID=1759441 RepID=A0A166UNB1_9AGAM|nr:urease accessory protein UreF [Fibularhizoctonia sp. CBS 109695]
MATDDAENYILLLLSDSNLPTGSFVASSGLESHVKHGFGSSPTSTIDFVEASLATYAHSALPFASDAHLVVESFAKDAGDQETLEQLQKIDDLYESMTLNHVARRASRAQGVALLTLYSKGFAPPSLNGATPDPHGSRLLALANELKMRVRRNETPGHLPVCWGVLTAALGLSLERSQYLHLFLHARSLLSAAVRLNVVGPYGAQQILLHSVRPLVTREHERCKDLRSSIVDTDDEENGPAGTWPLGEILAARHDLQHSRIFNS